MKRKKNKKETAQAAHKSVLMKRPKPKLEGYLSILEVWAWRDLMDAYKAAYNYLDSKLLEDGYNCSRFQIKAKKFKPSSTILQNSIFY